MATTTEDEEQPTTTHREIAIPTSYKPPPKKASSSGRRRNRTIRCLCLVALAVGGSVLGHLVEWQLVPSNYYSSHRAKTIAIEIAIEIPTNQNSRFVVSNVAKIVHVPFHRRIEVHLQGDYYGTGANARECKWPLLWGRLSGWALVSLGDFKMQGRNLLVASYDLWEFPKGGKYSLEIIVLLCETRTNIHLGEQMVHRTKDLTQQCLYEHGLEQAHHRLTHDDASIHVTMDARHSSSPAPPSRMGRWIHRDLYGYWWRASLPPPIYARYQAVGCRYRDDAQRDVCQIKESPACLRKNTHEAEVASMDKFLKYTYHWNENGPYAGLNHGSSSSPPKPPNEQQPVTVCFVGDSHSREMASFCEGWLERWGYTAAASSNHHHHDNGTSIHADESSDDPVSCTWIQDFASPSDVTPDKVRDTMQRRRCTHAVVGLFQWYFSAENNTQNTTVTLNDWKSKMETVVTILANPDHSGPSLRRILLRSLHPNAMGYQHSMCPPMDVRTLANAGEATAVVRQIALGYADTTLRGITPDHNHTNNSTSRRRAEVRFVDTRFLLDPVWDSNQDWSHYTWEAGDAETGFVLWNILEDEQERERG